MGSLFSGAVAERPDETIKKLMNEIQENLNVLSEKGVPGCLRVRETQNLLKLTMEKDMKSEVKWLTPQTSEKLLTLVDKQFDRVWKLCCFMNPPEKKTCKDNIQKVLQNF